MLRTTILLLLTLQLNGQDSLFLNSEFGATHEDNPCTLGTEIKTKAGVIKALKFYKPDATAVAYTIMVWSNSTTKIFSQDYRSTTTGWQRIPVSIPVNDGVYTISVYNPVGKYNYRKTTFPISKGSITGQAGKFGYTTGFPLNSSSTTYFIDAVIGSVPVVPLSVKTSIDRDETMPKDSAGVFGTITGAVKYKWTIEDQQGNFILKDTNTLRPYIIPKDSTGCRVWLMLTVTDASGNELADVVAIRVAPHPKLIVEYRLLDGTIIYRIKPTYIELP